jgi:hypothetical protein
MRVQNVEISPVAGFDSTFCTYAVQNVERRARDGRISTFCTAATHTPTRSLNASR